MKKKLAIPWFLLGLGSQLQVLFSLSISEVIVLFVAPFLIASEIQYMRKHGVQIFFYMAIFVFVGCVLSLLVNHSEFYQVIRGLSVTCIVVCAIVVGHYMIRNDPQGLKWYFFGTMLSGFLCIFVFQRMAEVSMVHGTDVDLIMSGPLFWIQRLSALLTTPILASYLKLPLGYSIGVPLFLSLFSILVTESGRAASLTFLGAAAVVMLGRKKQRTMMSFGRHFILIFCLAAAGMFVVKAAYQWAVMSDYLGEKARSKFEHQTANGTGVVQLLIGGRADSFVGLLAVADSPIFGKGYWAPDTEGYYEEFLSRYGNTEDYDQYIKNYYSVRGMRATRMISCHSHITSFWVWYGLPGLAFWLYVIFVMFRYLKYDAYAVPQWFYWLAAGVPNLLWHIFFSPFNARLGLPLCIVGMLIARSVRLCKYQLPPAMIYEINKSEMK